MSDNYALLLTGYDVPPDREEDFNRWYEEHVRERVELPGFLNALRFKLVRPLTSSWTKYLTLYDVEHRESLSSPEYQRRRSEGATSTSRSILDITRTGVRNTYVQIHPERNETPERPEPYGVLLLVMLGVNPEAEDEFNRWYNEEHIPMLMEIPGFLRARRYAAIEGAPKYLAVYELASADAIGHDGFKKATSTPWRARVMEGVPDRRIAIYQEIFRGAKGADGRYQTRVLAG